VVGFLRGSQASKMVLRKVQLKIKKDLNVLHLKPVLEEHDLRCGQRIILVVIHRLRASLARLPQKITFHFSAHKDGYELNQLR
jgi:hypothetical protein